jgi:hypothetical protein
LVCPFTGNESCGVVESVRRSKQREVVDIVVVCYELSVVVTADPRLDRLINCRDETREKALGGSAL